MKNIFEIRILLVAVVTVVLFGSCSRAISKEELAKEAMLKVMEETGSKALSVAVVKNGEIIYAEAFGKRDMETGEDISKDDLFRIASISKSFTTTALMTLVDAGKLSLDTDMGDILGFKVRNPKFPDKVITVRLVLSHSSSLNDSQGYFSLNTINPQTNPDYGLCYNDYEPGTKYEYCNLGFNMIGTTVEKLSGERFDNYVRRVVLQPLGLEAGFNVDSLDRAKFVTIYEYVKDTLSGEMVPQAQPAAYVSRGKEIAEGYVQGYSTPIFSPTGGMKISAQGLAHYMRMHMNYGKDPVSGTRIISEQNAKLMQTPVIEDNPNNHYAFALKRTKNLIYGQELTGHTGSAYGLYSGMFFDPEKGYGIVMMTSSTKPEYVDGYVKIQRNTINALYDIFIAE
jgi:Beta-lactamase class C and other penicillin binding proteins